MKRILLSALCFGALISAGAQGRIDMRARTLMNQEKPTVAVLKTLGTGEVQAVETTVESIPMIIELEDGQTTAGLEAIGIYPESVIGSFVVAQVPVDALASLDIEPTVRLAQTANEVRQYNDKARASMNVDNVHSGQSLPQAFNGEGVYVSIFDGGFDPNHINFMKGDDLTQSRVKAIWNYNFIANRVTTNSYLTPEEIARYETDSQYDTHGTHVLGIATGAYDNGKSGERYYGMAPGSDILIACGSMTEDTVLKGLQTMIEKAEQEGRPIAINLSIGINNGPHDGSDNFCRALDELAKRAVIAIAAGNEAEDDIALQKTLTADDNEVKTYLYITDNTRYNYGFTPNDYGYGYFDIYSSDGTPLDAQFVLADANGNIVESYSIAGETTITSSLSKTNFKSTFQNSSYAKFTSEVDPANNRYHIQGNVSLKTKSSSPTYFPAIVIKGNPGVKVGIYSQAYTSFTNKGMKDWDDATPDGTINSWACGHNVISVGSYSSRSAIGSPADRISYFSSYGTLFDGRTLPDICAPGSMIRSSYSRYYKTNPLYDKVQLTVNYNGKTYTWGDMEGTSMATPAMVGVAALWLQANPDLNSADVKDIAKQTATRDKYVNDGIPAQWGAGKLNAYEGIKMALNYAGVENVIADGNPTILVHEIGNGVFEVFGVDETAMTVSAYNMGGSLVASTTSAGDTVNFDLSAAAPGIYVLHVAGTHATHSEKIIIR